LGRSCFQNTPFSQDFGVTNIPEQSRILHHFLYVRWCFLSVIHYSESVPKSLRHLFWPFRRMTL
jgi:hypothetical protein